MNIIKLIAWNALFAFTIASFPAIAQDSNLQREVEAIRSVAEVKTRIRELMVARDNCGVGSCYNSTSTAICEQVGMLDVRVDGKIFSGGTGWTDAVLPISRPDLDLMKLVFNQCQPSNYQYWNWGQMLHVLYQPSCPVDLRIRRTLGLNGNSSICDR